MATDRVTARVLPVSPDGRVLLLQDRDPAVPEVLRWGTVGGGVDPGESLLEAAVRELFEETGVVAAPDQLVGPVHQDSRAFSCDGVDHSGHSTFFAVVAARWWAPDELAEAGGMIAADLPDVVRAGIAAVGGGTP
ncbi:NUDIX domain-containing protein [Nocardioides anomalus]|uniref:NUDIX domain-containing protein n=1 Tax=Nocardioides anomalus TaxID=2712223 RepID=A0A6G6WDJ6_9ACTN|nr:NUDIX domain-containing protein [Nocardioides anomalus]QIG43421.1 NUDIX domain-containing protein [Nocardioides anomalus]